MTDRIGLLGAGLLHDTIATALGERVTLPAEPPGAPVAMRVVASDAWDISHHSTARRLADDGTPWLPVRTELGHAVVGPIELPRRPGCVDCAAARRRRIQTDRKERAAVWRRYGDLIARRPSAWLTGLGAQLVADLVTEEVDRALAGDEPRTRLALLRVDLGRLRVRRHPYLPDPACPVCGDRPEDTAQLARISLAPTPAHRPGSYRTREVSGELPRLEDTYVDEETGLIRSLHGHSDGPLVVTTAPVGWRIGSEPIAGYGAAGTFPDSRLTALLEALERYGSSPGGRRTTVPVTYHEVADHALDPRDLGLHSPEQYAVPGFRYRPFSPDHPYRWVWGWSFARREPILVPDRCVYYGIGHRSEDGHGFVDEISNGCALGGSLAEAILHGILEVTERDAFLMTWYARLPATRIDLATAGSGQVPLLAASIRAETGYQVVAFDITTEPGIPCVWVMAVNPARDGRPARSCAAGTHPVPETAVRRALTELVPSLAGLVRRWKDPTVPPRAREMAADPTLVTEMDDHILLSADPGAATRLDFLTGAGPVRHVGEVGGGADPGGFASDDLRDNVREAVARYTDRGMDVIVVDQTASEHRAGGFHCVKVLIPGTLPMTFGHHYRRVHGLPRLYQVPQLLGYHDRPLAPVEVNPHPHPFP